MGITAEEALGASMTYTNKKVSESAGLHREIVDSLPATGDDTTIYMILDSSASGSDIYDEWMWINGRYEHIGSTRVDLTDYYNKTQVDTALNGKQDTLTFDNVPTQNSNNPVKSGGIFSTMGVPRVDTANRRMYLEGGAAFDGNIDSAPTAGSNNAVASGGTKTYVDNVINTALDNSKIAVFTQTFSNVTIDKAWGVLYESLQQRFDISSLGLQSPPKAVYLGLKQTPNAIMFELLSPGATSIAFHFIRPNQLTTAINITATALVVY